jgi:hypothetical protein
LYEPGGHTDHGWHFWPAGSAFQLPFSHGAHLASDETVGGVNTKNPGALNTRQTTNKGVATSAKKKRPREE